MSDNDLRTRIADIVDEQKPILRYHHCEMVADAVLHEIRKKGKLVRNVPGSPQYDTIVISVDDL